MANIKILKPRQIESLGEGTHADGGNLFLRVRSKNSRQWIFRYKRHGKVTEISLGPTLTRGITEARDMADAMRKAIRDGVDPASIVRKVDPGDRMTFKTYADRIDQHRRPTLKPGRHVDKFANSLREYVYPFIGDKRPGDISYQDVEDILKQVTVGAVVICADPPSAGAGMPAWATLAIASVEMETASLPNTASLPVGVGGDGRRQFDAARGPGSSQGLERGP